MIAVLKTMRGLLSSVAGVALVAVMTLPTPVLAGFEWTPPVAETPAPTLMPAQAAPVADVDVAGPLTPDPDVAVPVAAQDAVATPLQTNDLPVPTSSQSPDLQEAPAAASQEIRSEIAEKPPESAPVRQPAPTTVDLDMSPVQGFGKDIPLAIALRQIAPAQYAYRFEDGVSAGQKVSWQGGKPWPHVLSDMLAASGLQVVIVGNVISVQQDTAGVQAASPENLSEVKRSRSVDLPDAPEESATSDDAKAAPVEPQVARTAYVPGSASAPQADGAPTNIQTEAQVAEASEIKVAADVPVAAVVNKAAPVVDIQNTHRWEAEPGRTLRETLEKWSVSAGTEIEWMSPYDYPVEHSFVFNGKFNDAVKSLLALYSRETPRPRGRLYPNLPSGPSVLMIN